MGRRSFLLGCGLTGTGLLGWPSAAQSDERDVRSCRPDDPLKALQEGNRRFASAWQRSSSAVTPEDRSLAMASLWKNNCVVPSDSLSNRQAPWASVLCCSDSRVAPEWVFDAVPSDLFVVRSAGNTAFTEAVASLEYAVSVLSTPLILVMGHSNCGAVTAAQSHAPLSPLLEQLVAPIRNCIGPDDSLDTAIRTNARCTAGQLTERSGLLADAVTSGALSIRCSVFDIASGLITLI